MWIKLIVLSIQFSFSREILRCSKIGKISKYNFHIMQTCTQSTQKVISRKVALNIENCKEFSYRLSGLAFNYADSNTGSFRENCIVYDCPEFNVTSLKPSEYPYHYYSAYAGIYPVENMTCLPREGIFLLSGEMLNYTDAVIKCGALGGKLMNILTEETTIRAANVIAKSKVGNNKLTQAYVGLDDMKQEGKFLTVDDEPLNCVSFRSWAPGEPKSKFMDEDCVTIDTTRHWRVQRCNATFPYICEIMPNGPLNLTQAYCLNIEDAGMKKECSDYFTSAEIEIENETCNRSYEELQTIKERVD